MFFSLFRDFLRPCEALCQMKKQQIKIKCWIWCLRTVYYNMQCAKIIFQKIPPSYSRALWDCHVLARELTDKFKKITKSCQSKIDSFYSTVRHRWINLRISYQHCPIKLIQSLRCPGKLSLTQRCPGKLSLSQSGHKQIIYYYPDLADLWGSPN